MSHVGHSGLYVSRYKGDEGWVRWRPFLILCGWENGLGLRGVFFFGSLGRMVGGCFMIHDPYFNNIEVNNL